VNECEDDPERMGSAAIVDPVDGLNHSTANVRELDIAERSTVKDPPDGA
jgi:hypothetical protein